MIFRSCKTVVLGLHQVGKSTFVTCLAMGIHEPNSESTIGARFLQVESKYLQKNKQNGQYFANYQIWDTAGQPRYASLLPMYYRQAMLIAMYAAHDLASLHFLKEHCTKFEESNGKGNNVVVLGNIIAGKKRQVAVQDIVLWCQTKGYSFAGEINVTQVQQCNAAFMIAEQVFSTRQQIIVSLIPEWRESFYKRASPKYANVQIICQGL